MKFRYLIAVLLSLNTLSAVAATKKSAESMELVPSVWAAWMRGSMVVNGQKARIDRAADNYFEDLSLGGSLELALRNSSMVLLGTVDYFDPVSSDVTVNGLQGSLDSSQLIGCIAIGMPLAQSSDMTFDFLLGLQGQRMDNTLKVNGTRQSNSTDLYDTVLMLRIKFMLTDKFYLNVPLMYGGGLLGNSEQVYDAGVQLLFKMTDAFDLRAGYRISGYEYQEDSNNAWDYYQQGYTLSLGMTF